MEPKTKQTNEWLRKEQSLPIALPCPALPLSSPHFLSTSCCAMSLYWNIIAVAQERPALPKSFPGFRHLFFPVARHQ